MELYRTIRFLESRSTVLYQKASAEKHRTLTLPGFEISKLRFEIHAKRGGGCKSVGRAGALQAIGQEVDSPQLHQFEFQIRDLEFEIRALKRGPVAQLVRACA